MNNKKLETGMIMDGVSSTPQLTDKKQTLDAAIGSNRQEELMQAMALYKSMHTSKVREYKIGRNEPCPCGSGLKYKNCCLSSGKYEKYITKNNN